MAAKVNKVEVEIVAIDEASPKIDRLTKRIDGLESDEARIIVTAETERFERQLSGAKRLAETLTGDELTVQMRVVGRLEQDLEDARALFNQLDGQTGTVTLTADTTNFDAAAARARTSIDDVGRSADSSKSVLANMVGNATQDLGALGGVAGSAGVAIGQMGEYMADASASGERLGSILKNFALVAGPIAVLAVAFEAVQTVAARFRESAERSATAVDAVSDAVEEGENALKGYNEQLRELDGVVLDNAGSQSKLENVVAGINDTFKGLVPQWRGLAEAMGVAGDQTEDITPLLNRAGIDVREWGQLVETSAARTDEFAEALAESALTSDEVEKVMRALTQQQELYNEGVRKGEEVSRFFADALHTVGAEFERIPEPGEFARFGGVAAENFGIIEESAEDAADAVSTVRSAFQDLLGVLDKREAIRNAEQALEDVAEAAENAFIKANTEEATEAMRDYEEAVDDAIRKLIIAGADPVTINTVLQTFDQGQINEALAIAQAKLAEQPPLKMPVALDFRDTNLRIDRDLNVRSLYTPPAPSLNFGNLAPTAPNVVIIQPQGQNPNDTYNALNVFGAVNGDRTAR